MNSTQEWFCYDYYYLSGRPKMENELFEYAKKMILYHLVAEGDFKEVLKQLELRQEILAGQNPRWRKVEIRYSDGLNGHCWLYIGDLHFSFQKVLGNF